MTMIRWILKYLLHPFWLVTRGMTLGVRAIVVDDKERILLVRHTYVPGWYLPGGGVDRGETMAQAMARELVEETGVTVIGEPEFIAIYRNPKMSNRDHVGLYICRNWQRAKDAGPNLEIAESGFFALDKLPRDTTAGTRARLGEFFNGQDISPNWS